MNKKPTLHAPKTSLVHLILGLSDGIDFGSSKDNNNSVTHVDEEALSGFAYDYDEEEDTKNKGDSTKMMDNDKAKINGTDKPVNSAPEPETEPEPVTGKSKFTLV